MTSPTILIRGRAHAGLTAALIGFTIAESTDGLYRCEAAFTNWGPAGRTSDFLFFDPRVLDFGMAFRVDVDRPLFDGRVMALEAAFGEAAAPTLTVLAEDRLQDLRMTRRTRTFTDASAGDVIRAIAADHDLSAQVAVTGPQHATLAQVNQSDLAFLRSLVRDHDAEVWVEEQTLHVSARQLRDAGTVTLEYPTTLLECVAMADLAHQRTSVEVAGWDPGTKSAIRHEATEGILADELHGGSSGVKVLAAALGLRRETVVHAVPQSHEEARAQAESLFKGLARRFVVVQGAVRESSELRVGSFVDLGGLGARLSGRYYVTAVQHTFDPTRGFRTEFTAESASLSRGTRVSEPAPVRRARTAPSRPSSAAGTAVRRSGPKTPSAGPGKTSRRRGAGRRA